MRKFNLTIALISCGIFAAMGAEIKSPSGNIVVITDVTERGEPIYSVTLNGDKIIENARLGLVTDFTDLSTGLKETGIETGVDTRNYSQDKIKRKDISVNATTAKVSYEGDKKRKLDIEWHVADDGVAYRLGVPRQRERGSMRVLEEKNSFNFPESTTKFVTSQSDPMIGWKRTKPSYEEFYLIDVPLSEPSEYGHGFTFPALFKTPENNWVLVTETGVDGYYCGSHLSDYNKDGFSIAFPMQEENNGNGMSTPAVALPGYSPWRVMAIGDNLSTIVETTLPWDLVEPKYEVDFEVKPGKGTWSWILWQDDSINYEDQVKFIDFAAEMGYENVLVDNWWDRNIGREGIAKLNRYAKDKGVNLIMWFSSSGDWNDIEQGPINLMDRPIVRKETMKWLKDNDIHAIKVDFFGGDKQETIRLYEDILSDAADHDIQVIFHGCTLPRGWERMYPNFVGAEAVLASENMIFTQEFCDREAELLTLHPFIRNSAAIMEYGGTFLNKRMSRDNAGGNIRRTSDAFQLATAILNQNPVQNFALAPNNLTDAPEVAINFMKEVPTTWDDTKYIAGYPGKYVVLARKHGDNWYIAGISNEKTPLELELNLPMLKEGSTVEMINDDKKGEPVKTALKIKNPGKVKIKLNPLSGFIIKG
ncbi:MAG: glycoside hydrolase family 97 catalytic domain-containing protein [Muribaculaceae bacterium]|nr:glycoside hydrolase family 97 catalytic domain-containing protein [Muribaculaceae bacterium]